MKVTTKGVDEAVARVKALPNAVSNAAYLSVSNATRFAYSQSSKQIRKEVNLTQAYLSEGNKFFISQRPTAINPTGIILARKRATSLARYALDRNVGNRKSGVRVSVNPGRSTLLKKAFLIRLRSGTSLTEDHFNLGLAVRIKRGHPLINKRRMQQYSNTSSNAKTQLYLLYAPSVDQVFKGVARALEPKISQYLENEFLRQLARGLNG